MKINNKDWMPCYLDPDFNELQELADSHWDTIRILTIDEPRLTGTLHECIVMASGYGNTHETLARNIRNSFGLKRTPFCYDFILYKSCGKPYFNDLSTGNDEMEVEEMLRSFTTKQQQILVDLIALSDLRYDS